MRLRGLVHWSPLSLAGRAEVGSPVESPVLMEQTWQRPRVSLLWRGAWPAAIHDG